MTRFRYIFLVVSSLLYLVNAHAQVPGYLGKRLAIGYAPSIMPFASIFDFKAADGTDLTGLALNIKHRIDLNYVVSEHTTLSFDYSFQKWGVISNLNGEGKLVSKDDYYDEESMFREFGLYDCSYVYTTSNKFTLSLVTSKAIAPRGNYFAIGLSYESISPKMVDIEGKTIDLDPLSDIGLTMRFGKRRVFFDKILIDGALSFEANTGFIYAGSSLGDYNAERRGFGGSNYGGLKKEDLNKEILKQAALHTLISLRLGVYYLL
ncbi:MAG: hypothetical protein V4538_05785 [Bacteroidota bacterium]